MAVVGGGIKNVLICVTSLMNARYILFKVHRLQSNRVCLGLLTGQDYPGEKHPDNCPCTAHREREEKDRKKLEERKKEEEEKKKEIEEKREVERMRREKMLDQRKKRFYSKMKSDRPYPGATDGIVRLDKTSDVHKEGLEHVRFLLSIPS